MDEAAAQAARDVLATFLWAPPAEYVRQARLAVANGLDLTQEVDPNITVAQALLNAAEDEALDALCQDPCNILQGPLRGTLRLGDLRRGLQYLDLAIRHDHRDEQGEGPFAHLLQGPSSETVAPLLRQCFRKGVATTPPEGTTWFHVWMEHPGHFEPGHVFSERRCRHDWQTVQALLDMGLDPAARDAKGVSGLDLMQALIARGDTQPPPEVPSLIAAQCLQEATMAAAPARARPRI